MERHLPMPTMPGQQLGQDTGSDHRLARTEPRWRSQSIGHQSLSTDKITPFEGTRQRLARSCMGSPLPGRLVGPPGMVKTQSSPIERLTRKRDSTRLVLATSLGRTTQPRVPSSPLRQRLSEGHAQMNSRAVSATLLVRRP